jgi:hypothetical protein
MLILALLLHGQEAIVSEKKERLGEYRKAGRILPMHVEE